MPDTCRRRCVKFGNKGPSTKYATLFWNNFDAPSLVTLCHTSRDPLKWHNISDPQVLVVHTYIHTFIHTYIHTYIHIYIYICIYMYIYVYICIYAYICLYSGLYYSSRGFYPGVLSRAFVWMVLSIVVLSYVPLLSEYICYNRKLNTFNFRSLDLSPVASCHTFSNPSSRA